VEYEELPAIFDPEAALSNDAPKVHLDGNLADYYLYERGNIEQGFRDSDEIFEGRFLTQMTHQSYLEPRGCLASCDASGRVTIWGGFSAIFRIRGVVARALNLSENQVRVIQTPCGGSFGGKGSSSKAAVCALLSQKTNRPVKIINSRTDEFMAARPRASAVIDQKIGVKRDGMLVAKETRVVLNCGAYLGSSASNTRNLPLRPEGFYRFAHLKGEGFTVYTNRTPTGPCRGFGNPEGAFAIETQLDDIARALSIDPVDLRLKNIVQTGDTTIHGWKMSSCGLRECLVKVRQLSTDIPKKKKNNTLKGLGFACCIHNSGSRKTVDFDGSSAFVKVETDGSVTLITGEGDTGQGSWSVLAQLVAEELGVPFSQVNVSAGDTDVAPYCLGAFAGRVTVIGGNAALAAAEDAKRQLLEVAAGLLEANPTDLETRSGSIFVKGTPGRSLSLAEVSRAAVYRRGGGPILGRGTYDPPTDLQDKETLYGNFSPNYPFCAVAAEVEVDKETGETRVVSLVAADDLGRAINPLAAEGQIDGCVSHGLGFALMEEIVWDGGKIINPNLADYRVPAATDTMQLKSLLIETNDPVGPFGAKAVGETSVAPVTAAIANAVYDAIGVRIRSLPLTSERILKAVEEKLKPKGE
jgi:CO/xanthine dehydrogenase Mo-binding subunit